MKILICEDNDRKFDNLANCITDSGKVHCKMTRTISITETKREIVEGNYDVLIQDMQIPRYIDDCIDIRGGIEVLQYIKYRGIKIPSILYTSADDGVKILEEAKLDIPVAKYSTMSIDWKKDIINFLKGIGEQKDV